MFGCGMCLSSCSLFSCAMCHVGCFNTLVAVAWTTHIHFLCCTHTHPSHFGFCCHPVQRTNVSSLFLLVSWSACLCGKMCCISHSRPLHWIMRSPRRVPGVDRSPSHRNLRVTKPKPPSALAAASWYLLLDQRALVAGNAVSSVVTPADGCTRNLWMMVSRLFPSNRSVFLLLAKTTMLHRVPAPPVVATMAAKQHSSATWNSVWWRSGRGDFSTSVGGCQFLGNSFCASGTVAPTFGSNHRRHLVCLVLALSLSICQAHLLEHQDLQDPPAAVSTAPRTGSAAA